MQDLELRPPGLPQGGQNTPGIGNRSRQHLAHGFLSASQDCGVAVGNKPFKIEHGFALSCPGAWSGPGEHDDDRDDRQAERQNDAVGQKNLARACLAASVI